MEEIGLCREICWLRCKYGLKKIFQDMYRICTTSLFICYIHYLYIRIIYKIITEWKVETKRCDKCQSKRKSIKDNNLATKNFIKIQNKAILRIQLHTVFVLSLHKKGKNRIQPKDASRKSKTNVFVRNSVWKFSLVKSG